MMALSQSKIWLVAAALVCMGLGAAAAQSLPEKPQPVIRKAHFPKDVCNVIWQQSELHGLPAAFFARLIWKESLFDPNALSPKGAQGIAQFMPATAEENGLQDPFVPHEALQASAKLLAKLRGDFGNLGLAAAAYNAGPDRISSWLAGSSELPVETQDYVSFITGQEAQEWSQREARFAIPAIGKDTDFATACIKLALRQLSLARKGSLKRAGKILGFNVAAGVVSEAAASQVKRKHGPMVLRTGNLTMRARKLTIIRVSAGARAEAQTLCAKLRTTGGACTVAKN